jgi:hypothetical protein
MRKYQHASIRSELKSGKTCFTEVKTQSKKTRPGVEDQDPVEEEQDPVEGFPSQRSGRSFHIFFPAFEGWFLDEGHYATEGVKIKHLMSW